MICQNCQARVDDDLIFCTNCGKRLSAPSEATVVIPDSAKIYRADEPVRKNSSNAKWIALIVALIAIPATIFGVYLLMSPTKNSIVSQNVNKPVAPAQTPTRKSETNQNTNVSAVNINANTDDTNSAESNENMNVAAPKDKKEIMNERIEISPKSHYAIPFTIEGDTSDFRGKVEVLQGESYKGYVYLQTQYDEHFPDETYKMFIFGQEKTSEIKSRLIPENYVLIFSNDGDNPVTIRGNFWVE